MLCRCPSFLRKNVTPYLIRGRNPGSQPPGLWMPDQVRHDENVLARLQLIVKRSCLDNYSEDQMRLSEGQVIDIVRVEQVSAYTLRLSFSDGAERVINFEPFLRTSHNPLIRVYLDPEKFADFTLEYGNLMWDDYGLCFPIADLYENTIY